MEQGWQEGESYQNVYHFLARGFIIIFDSFYNIKIPILYIDPYLILFPVFEHISFMHSNRLISFWKDQTSFSIYVKGGTHIHIAYIFEAASSITISVLLEAYLHQV